MKLGVFRNIVWDFYKKNKRDLPWRNTKDPYKILVSEVMLQQTQVASVLPKFKEFVREFPDFSALSKATLKQILGIWKGLGYNRRALYLKEIAGIVVGKYKGVLPKDPKILDSFPGIGEATASAIALFSFDKPLAFIETNIRRVFIHHFFKNKIRIKDKDILPLILSSIDGSNPREWYYALMDYGAMFSKEIKNPNRKSAHYARQSQFEGSVRQVRGKILAELLKLDSLELKLLEDKISAREFFDEAVLQLQEEGFIQVKNKIARIA